MPVRLPEFARGCDRYWIFWALWYFRRTRLKLFEAICSNHLGQPSQLPMTPCKFPHRMFADEPEVIDEILEEIMSDRAAQFEAR